jgi:transcriptional regulator GlxA family with amidase domain
MFTNMRLERAARDLRDSEKNVTEISLDCGFSQPDGLKRKLFDTATVLIEAQIR